MFANGHRSHRSPLEAEMQRNEIVTVTDAPYRLKRGRLWGKPPSNGRGCPLQS
ncbi:hypothetical protein J2Z66_006797 [Paenibacillus eucommiae]|uniref:Transposase n=1 Tax=Paenibacillus eucommiae TaxID=1355755 RepID=A0ABS4J7B3_9BACL|nr:hypothetical protein [Paenibacillus eucommiae]